jgi:molybdopterin-synthase adenylyltransferase
MKRLFARLLGARHHGPAPDQPERGVELWVPDRQFAEIRRHVEDLRRGEEAGFLICGVSRLPDRDLLLGREWLPVPDDAVTDRGGRYGLAWSGAFNARVVGRADAIGAAAVLIHFHGGSAPRFSTDDDEKAAELFPPVSRLLDGRPSGSVVLGSGAAYGEFWRDGRRSGELRRLRIVGAPLEDWPPDRGQTPRIVRRRLDRQTIAIGPESDARLAAASVAVIGVSGGGSHVCQQLAHQGVGRIVPVDDQLVEDVQLGRMVGAQETDIDVSYKTAVMHRLITSVDSSLRVDEVRSRFPSPEAIAALKTVDVVVSCVDTFGAREQINAFCRRYHLPLVDIGMGIRTERERLESAHGQLVVVTPDSPCLRCTPLLADEVLERERELRPPGYDENPDAPGEPQVVSMNGVLASEACNSVLDLLTGYAGSARGPGWWLYDGRTGSLTPAALPPRWRRCPACAEQAHGDPAVIG